MLQSTCTLLYVTILRYSEEKLCRLVSEFGRVCERRKLRVNVGRSKLWGAPGMVMGSNASDTKRRTVRGSGLF